MKKTDIKPVIILKKKYTLRLIVLIIAVIPVLAAVTGCANLLEGYDESINKHQAAPYVRPPTEFISVNNYDELVATLIKLIMDHETEAQLLYYHLDGEDVHEEVERARHEILEEHLIGIYAVADITAEATRIVTHFEVSIRIEYKRTKEQVDSIVNISSERYLRTQLLNIMSEYKEEAIIRTHLQITEEDIERFVVETYYQNPGKIVMLPFVRVAIFPEEAVDRIYEIQFGYTMENTNMLQLYGEELAYYVRQNAELAEGETDSEILLFLVNNLLESTTFDEAQARTIHVHGPQNFAATAFGALIHGSAVGEGFAMAFKAICDEVGLDNRIVLGHYDGRIHAWNIVELYGDYYHIDVAMCAVNGIETAFLKTDVDFEEMYTWDRANTVRCEGELTLEDIIGPEEEDLPEDIDENGGEPNDNGEGG